MPATGVIRGHNELLIEDTDDQEWNGCTVVAILHECLGNAVQEEGVFEVAGFGHRQLMRVGQTNRRIYQLLERGSTEAPSNSCAMCASTHMNQFGVVPYDDTQVLRKLRFFG